MQTRTELVRRLEEWAIGVARSLRKGHYRPWADDIGREVCVVLLEKKSQGIPVPAWTGVLEGEPRRLVDQIARRYRPRHHEAFDEKEYRGNKKKTSTWATEDDDSRQSRREPPWIALSDE